MSETEPGKMDPALDEAKSDQHRSTARRRWLVGLIAAAGLAISVAAWQAMLAHEQELIETRFGGDADARIRSVERQLQRDVELVYLLIAFYASSEEVTRD